jgi:hypothetical protein
MQKVYFAVNARLFLACYLSAGFGTFLQVSALASHWLENCANFTPNPEENDQYSAKKKIARIVQYKQQAQNIPLVIAGMAKRSS